MEAKSSSQMGAIFYPMFANWNHAKQFWPIVHVSDRANLFLPNCRNFAVEYDWNSEITQNV